MSYFRSDDPGRDFDRLDAKQSAWLKERPKCDHCDHHIQADHLYRINGEGICPDCLENYFREEIEV